MKLNNINKIKFSRTKEDFWNNNCLKITNYPSMIDKKVNTVYRWNRYKKINIKVNRGFSSINSDNTSLNTNTCSNNGKLPIYSKRLHAKSHINFFKKKISPVKRKVESAINIVTPKLKLKTNYRRENRINVVNLFKLSMMPINFNIDKNNIIEFKKPRINSHRISGNKKYKIDYLEENFIKKYINFQKMKYKNKLDFNQFLNNDSLRKYNIKSARMHSSKNDINNIYETSSFLHNIIDYIGAKLYKLKTKDNEIKELNKTSREKFYKKEVNVKEKEKRGEINKDKLFFQKHYDIDEEIFNNKLKAKLIYKNGYTSNSFKVLKNRIFNKSISTN